jgi:transmembrane sensor
LAVDRSTRAEIVAVTAAELARLLAWQPQLLDFSSAPLEKAVAEFNRRNRVQLVLADSTLAAMPIVASIRSDNVEGFVRILAAVPGVTIERPAADTIVVRRRL